ncbi:MAG: class I SAM-dependent methyltransferase [Rhizobiaceae bacterium]|nr:class I SAM-dependent methyltransferase [Rhizobiaceae bacterium]
MTTRIEHAHLMDRVYRHQRHFYDATRKFYLLGRDPMIDGLKPPLGGAVLEIGCGTGRNLIKTAQRYPSARLFGIDISSEMLDTAAKAIAAAGYRGQTRLAYADAADFDPTRIFGQTAFDRIFISYAVSMIPQWRTVIANATARLTPGGELHVVDFGDLGQLPRWSRSALYEWLRWYHVTPRPDLFSVCDEIAKRHDGTSRQVKLHRGFAWLATIRTGYGSPDQKRI